jgi:hypothetical protein
VILFRSLIFYPLLALAAAGLILLSLGPGRGAPLTPSAQAGVETADSVVFGPKSLVGIDAGDRHAIFAPRNGAGQAKSLHIAVNLGAPAPSPDNRGARLLLAPEAAARIAGQAVDVSLALAPMPFATAPKIAVSLQAGEGPVGWSIVDVPTEAKSVTVRLAAVAAPQAIGLYVVNPLQNGAVAVEIREIRATPVK